MVIGNGLLARAFEHYKDDDQIIIFASGVSNSKETDEVAYDREHELIQTMPKDKLIVYFSTCSMYDRSNSRYIRHKMHMERMAQWQSPRSIIFRLPNVVGPTDNPHTFFNYFKNKILSGDDINVQFMATRHLIDIKDVSDLCTLIIEKERKKLFSFRLKMEIGFNNEASVEDIVKMMLQILDKNNKITIGEIGSNYNFPTQQCEEYMKEFNYTIPDDYNYKLLKKYL